MKTRHKQSQTNRCQTDPSRTRTNVEGQNPQANDSPDTDLYHDDNRPNLFNAHASEPVKGDRKAGPE